MDAGRRNDRGGIRLTNVFPELCSNLFIHSVASLIDLRTRVCVRVWKNRVKESLRTIIIIIILCSVVSDYKKQLRGKWRRHHRSRYSMETGERLYFLRT